MSVQVITKKEKLNLNPDIDFIHQAVLDGDAELAAALAKRSLEAGLDPLKALEPFVAAIRHAGELFEEGDFFLPQLLLASNAMKAVLGVLFPQSGGHPSPTRPTQGTVVAGTVQGDIHEIGKNLVCALLTAHGFRVVDLGSDVPLDKFVEQAVQINADLLALSALLTTTMIQQKTLIEKLDRAGLRGKVKVMVGGAPVNAAWATSIGADGYAPDAARAVDEALRLIGKPRA